MSRSVTCLRPIHVPLTQLHFSQRSRMKWLGLLGFQHVSFEDSFEDQFAFLFAFALCIYIVIYSCSFSSFSFGFRCFPPRRSTPTTPVELCPSLELDAAVSALVHVLICFSDLFRFWGSNHKSLVNQALTSHYPPRMDKQGSFGEASVKDPRISQPTSQRSCFWCAPSFW